RPSAERPVGHPGAAVRVELLHDDGDRTLRAEYAGADEPVRYLGDRRKVVGVALVGLEGPRRDAKGDGAVAGKDRRAHGNGGWRDVHDLGAAHPAVVVLEQER